MTQTNEKQCSFMRFGLAFFVLLTVTFAIQYGVQFALEAINPALLDHPALTWILSTVPLYFVALPICLAILGKTKSTGQEEKSVMSFKNFLLAVVIVFGVTSMGSIAGNMLMWLVSLISGKTITNPVVDIISESNPVAVFISTVIIAPLGEEFIFRRLIIDNTRQYGERFSLILSAAMFSAFHTNVYQIPYAFLAGLVLGYIYLKAGKLRNTILLHAIINFSSGFLVSLLLKALINVSDNMTVVNEENMLSLFLLLLIELVYLAVLFGCMITTIVLGAVMYNKIKLGKSENKVNVFKSPFIMLFFAVCLFLTILRIILG